MSSVPQNVVLLLFIILISDLAFYIRVFGEFVQLGLIRFVLQLYNGLPFIPKTGMHFCSTKEAI